MGIQAGSSAVTGVYLGDQLLTKGGEVTIKTLAEMAPGPSELKGGDWDCGYFGAPTTAEMGTITGTGTSADGQPITAKSLATATSFTAGYWQNNDIIWHKFVFKGEIIYVAQKPVRQNVTYKMLADLGLILGGTILKTTTANYRVTLLKGADPDLPPYSGSYGVTNSEWNKLILSLSKSNSTYTFGSGLTDNDLGFKDQSGNDKYSWVKEIMYMTSSSQETYALVRSGMYRLSVWCTNNESRYVWRPALRFTL